MDEQPVIYLNGDYVPLSEANISILDQGFLLGDGVFDWEIRESGADGTPID